MGTTDPINIKSFYDETTATLSYVVSELKGNCAFVVDPVLNYDQASSTISTESVDELESYIKKEKLKLLYCLETHAHADHLSGAQELKKRFPEALLAIGSRIAEVQEIFKKTFNFSEAFLAEDTQFDVLLKDGDSLRVGTMQLEVISTPGHTPACVSYLVGDAVFTGDAIFMPDTGTGRCDFPGGSSRSLFHSISQKLYRLPADTRVFVGHDYKNGGTRALQWESSIAQQKVHNIHVKESSSESDFVQMRDTRDKGLQAPKLLLPSLQVNIRGGRLPKPEANGIAYLKVPLTLK